MVADSVTGLGSGAAVIVGDEVAVDLVELAAIRAPVFLHDAFALKLRPTPIHIRTRRTEPNTDR